MKHGETYGLNHALPLVVQFVGLMAVSSALPDAPAEPDGAWVSLETKFWALAVPGFAAICAVALYWGAIGDTSDHRILLMAAVVLLWAFGVMNLSAQKRFGADVYDGAVTPPDKDQWILYTAVHVLHVGDVADLLHEYHVSFPVPRAAATLPRGLLVAFNAAAGVLMGVMLVTYLPGVLGAVGRRLKAARRWVLLAAAGLLAAVGATAVLRGWAPADWALWPADNFLRALDVADAMQVYGVRLHGVDPDPWTGALAVAVRLAVGTYVLGWLSGLRLGRLGGWGLSVPALIDEVRRGDDPRAALRVLEARPPRQLAPFALVFAEPLDPAEVPDPAVRRAFFGLLLRAAREPELVEGLEILGVGPEADRYPERPSAHLPDCVGDYHIHLWHYVPPRLDDEDEEVAVQAVRLLAGLPAGGPRDNVVVRMTGILGHPVEVNGAKLTAKSPGEGPWRQQGRATAVLAAIGPDAAAATPALLAVYRDPVAPAKLRLAAAKALKTVNPEAYARLPREKKRRD